MTRRRDALLWGVVGGLAFLVLVQGYELVGGSRLGIGVKFGVAAAVTAVVAGASYALAARLGPDESA